MDSPGTIKAKHRFRQPSRDLTCNLPLISLSCLSFTYIFSSKLSRMRSKGSFTVASSSVITHSGPLRFVELTTSAEQMVKYTSTAANQLQRSGSGFTQGNCLSKMQEVWRSLLTAVLRSMALYQLPMLRSALTSCKMPLLAALRPRPGALARRNE